MPMLFKVKWPWLAQLEAALLFPVAVAAAGVTASNLGIDAVSMVSGGSPSLLRLTAVVAIPYLIFLTVVDRLLIVRKGFAILACIATLMWAGAAAVLSDGLGTLMPGLANGVRVTSFHSLAALTGGLASFLAHTKFLWIGLRDSGHAALQMGVDLRVGPEARLLARRYLREAELLSAENGRRLGAVSQMVRGSKRMFRNLYDYDRFRIPLETALALILISGWLYGSYCWIYSVSHGNVDDVRTQDPVALRSTLIPKSPVIDGAATAVRDPAGRFIFNVTVNGQNMPMIYDDDVSLVTLRAEDAVRLGVSFERLWFSDKITTPRGAIEVAGITIGSMSVGSITYRLVPGFVARQGALDVSILGHSFLGRLATNRLRNNQLTVTGTR